MNFLYDQLQAFKGYKFSKWCKLGSNQIIMFQNVIRSLMYAMVCIKFDIAHAMGVVSQFMVNPG
jgi:hypothetical protein